MQPISGIASISSTHSVAETVGKLVATIKSKGLTLFAHIDHQAGAREAGLHMPAAQVLIFGHAKAGTPFMVASPLLALDLPLRVLISEDAEKKVWVSFHTSEAVLRDHPIPPELAKSFPGIEALVTAAVQ